MKWYVHLVWLLPLAIIATTMVLLAIKKRRAAPKKPKTGTVGQADDHEHPAPVQSREPKRDFWKLLWNWITIPSFLFLVLCAGLLLLGTRDALLNCSNRPRQSTTVVVDYAPPAPTPAGPVPHMFGADGCVETRLEGNWSMDSIPLKQAVNVFNERGRLVLEMNAEDRGTSLPAGMYRICRAPGSDALGVTITN